MHRLKGVAMLALAIVLAGTASAQVPCAAPRLVTVTGTAEVHVAPDRAVMRLGVDTSDPILAKAVADNVTRSERVIKVIKSAGIAPEKMQTDYLSIGQEDRTERSGFGTPAFRANRQITVILENVAQTEKLVTAALEAGATTVYQVSFETKDPKHHRDQARSLAIQAAKEKAQRLASELGAKIGAVQSITEQPSSRWGWTVQRNANVASDEGASAEQATTTIAPGQVTIGASVEVSFQIE